MRLPRLPYVVVDTNRIRDDATIKPLLADFRATGKLIVLPWTATREFYVGHNTQMFWRRVESISEEPDAIAFARPTMTIFQKIEVPFRRMVVDLASVIAHDGTRSIRAILRDFSKGVLDEQAAHATLAAATAQAAKLLAPWVLLFRAAVRTFVSDKKERAQVAHALRVGDRTMYRQIVARRFNRDLIAAFLVGMPIRSRPIGYATARRLSAMPTFASLMILAIGARAYLWGLQGKGAVDSNNGLINDGVDIENVLIALYGVGFISDDGEAVELYNDLQVIGAMLWP